MNSKRLHVLVLMDLPEPHPAERLEDVLHGDDWRTENDVVTALRQLGHRVRLVGLFDNLLPLFSAVESDRPDIVFNLVEHFNNNTAYERNVAGVIELLGLPYTGTGPTGLMLCKNKSLMKKLLSFHHIRTPRFELFYPNRAVAVPAHLRYPLIVKPAKEDASYGIAQSSFVRDKDELIERVRFVHSSLNQNALVEEYVDGRELTIGVIGNERLATFAPREVVFREVPDTEPKIATFRAKWDEEYRKRWGIQNRFADPLADGLAEKMATIAKRVYRTLHIHGYGRIDLRLNEKNDIMVIEANPNPAIGREEDLAMSAAKAGVGYPDLLQRLLQLAFTFSAQKK